MFRRRAVAYRGLHDSFHLDGIFRRALPVFGGHLVHGVGHLQLLAVRRLRLQGRASTNTEAGGNFYRLKRRGVGLKSSVHVVFRGNNFFTLPNRKTCRNRRRDAVELLCKKKGRQRLTGLIFFAINKNVLLQEGILCSI